MKAMWPSIRESLLFVVTFVLTFIGYMLIVFIFLQPGDDSGLLLWRCKGFGADYQPFQRDTIIFWPTLRFIATVAALVTAIAIRRQAHRKKGPEGAIE